MTGEPFSRRRCRACDKSFGSPLARANHERDVHTAKGLEKASALKAAQRSAKDDEPSMADLVVEASMNRAMSLPADEDIEAMFGEHL